MTTIIEKLKRLKHHLRRVYYVVFKKDPFMTEIFRWKKDRGDINLRLKYPLNENSIVIDVGGYMGDYSSDICCKYNPYIFIFEPISAYYEAIKNRFSDNPKVTVIHAGLADEDTKSSISIQDAASSIYSKVESATEEIRLISVIDFIRDHQISHIDLMKINIEGGEFKLLDAMINNNLLDIVNYYQIQFHHFVPGAQAKRKAIQLELEKGFDLQWDYPFVWESWQKKCKK